MRNFVVTGLLSGILAFTALSLIAQDTMPPDTKAPAQAMRATGTHEHKPMPKPTNLQVLPKDISSDDLIKTMHGFKQQLGVECEFCHDRDPQTHKMNFPGDKNPDKAIARTMIAMTQEINAKYLSQVQDPDATPEIKTVTCGTCHRGSSMPVVFKAKPEIHDQHVMPMQKKE
jgi:Photosynthetic reaction centre cytochrome C subunit